MKQASERYPFRAEIQTPEWRKSLFSGLLYMDRPVEKSLAPSAFTILPTQPKVPAMQNTINKLVGERCWAVIAGKGTGSAVDLGFGNKTPRKKPLKNPCLTEEERLCDAEMSIFIQNCAWRLSTEAEGLICTDLSDSTAGGEMTDGLQRLRGKALVCAKVDAISLDLHLTFETSLMLSVFCDCMSSENDGDNYAIFLPDEIYTAGAKSRLIIEKRTPAEY